MRAGGCKGDFSWSACLDFSSATAYFGQKTQREEACMKTELRKTALRYKVIEILHNYSRVRTQLYRLDQWKKLLIRPN